MHATRPVGAGLAREGGGTFGILAWFVPYSTNQPQNHFLIFYRY
jgi:hypothetical protein